MNRKELAKTFMMISNLKKTLLSMVYTEIIQRCKGYYVSHSLSINHTLACCAH